MAPYSATIAAILSMTSGLGAAAPACCRTGCPDTGSAQARYFCLCCGDATPSASIATSPCGGRISVRLLRGDLAHSTT
jgi:hypothetical protein